MPDGGGDMRTVEDFSTAKGSNERGVVYGGMGYDAPTIMKFSDST